MCLLQNNQILIGYHGAIANEEASRADSMYVQHSLIPD